VPGLRRDADADPHPDADAHSQPDRNRDGWSDGHGHPYSDTRMDTDAVDNPPHLDRLALADLRGVRDAFTEPELVGKPGDALIVTYGDADAHRFVVVDAHGRWIGHGTLSGLDFHVDSLSRGRRVLPLRGDPDPDAGPGALAGTHVHAHRHPHHAVAGDFLARTGLVVERYDHTHRHAHATTGRQRIPDDRQFHDDHEH
jgi:hypothetical protein